MDDKNETNRNGKQSKPGGDSRVSETAGTSGNGKTGNEKPGQKTGQMGNQKSGPKMSVASENSDGDMKEREDSEGDETSDTKGARSEARAPGSKRGGNSTQPFQAGRQSQKNG